MKIMGKLLLVISFALVLGMMACSPKATHTVAPIPTEPAEVAATITQAPAAPLPTVETVAPTLTEEVATQTSQPAVAVASGDSLLQARCTVCHSLDRVTRKTESLDEWRAIVASMVSRGAVLTAAEQSVLVEYLAMTYLDK
jgi:mono/diheme cytochrome c family protein